ncbi:hypothetical protein [Nocardioides jensenii]|uniref:hypothetical protein n=1 Tax=Nocardioides jensenii TaxID=1843 RepID=UPI00082BE76A|nr:hypothetical protein [Nocardioides jensenii]
MGKKVKTAAVVIGAGVKVAVKYGPQAKIAWDKGGKQAAASATKRARSLTARRKALAHAATVVDGSILKVAPSGTTAYVVFTGDQPIATYPPSELPFEVLLAHTDLTKRIHPEPKPPRRALPRGRR